MFDPPGFGRNSDLETVMFRPRVCVCILCPLIGLALLLFLLLSESTPEADAAQAGAKQVSYINDIAPIFKDNCFACHDSKKKKGKLDMTTYESFRKGGSSDDPVDPGKADESTLVELLTGTVKRMPPKEAGPPLPRDKIEMIKQWINQGAKLDDGISPKADLFRELRIRWQPPAPPAAYKYPVVVNALTFTPDSKRVVVGGYHELTVWDVDSGKLTSRLRTRAERAYGMAFLPDGNLVVVGGRPGQEGDVRVYNLNAKAAKVDDQGVSYLDGVHDQNVLVAHLLDCDDSMLALALSKDGKKLAAAGCDRLVRVWDIAPDPAKSELVYTFENHADWVFGLAYSADGKWLLSGSRDKTAKIWDLAAKESLVTFPDHQQTVYGVALSLDGKQALSVGEDGSLRVWQATDANKTLGKQAKGGGGSHSKAIFRLVVHGDPTKALAATCSADGTVKLWNPNTGKEKKTLTGPTDWVYAVAISPDAQLVAAGSWKGEVYVWKVADGTVARVFNASPGYMPPEVAAPKK
jgi:hypothetical protein